MPVNFSTQDLETMQRMAWPLVSMLSPINPAEMVQSTGPALGATALALEEAAEVFRAGEMAVQDGILSADELNTIVAEAKDAQAAVAAIRTAVEGKTAN